MRWTAALDCICRKLCQTKVVAIFMPNIPNLKESNLPRYRPPASEAGHK